MQIVCLNWNTYESKGGHHCYLCQDNRYKPSLAGDPGGMIILQVLLPTTLRGAAELPGGGWLGHVKLGFLGPILRD